MAANYLPYEPDQMLLLPESLQEWLPEGHLAHFISDAVDGPRLNGVFNVDLRIPSRTGAIYNGIRDPCEGIKTHCLRYFMVQLEVDDISLVSRVEHQALIRIVG